MTINFSILEAQRSLLKNPPKPALHEIEPLKAYEHSGNSAYRSRGELLVKEGAVGCILLAGGQGSRLGFPGPKGMFPICPEEHKTLFDLFADRVKEEEGKAGRSMPIAVMTSPENHSATVEFFRQNKLLDQVDFFVQTTLPLLDEAGELLVNSVGDVVQGPDGNGALFESFINAGLKEKWERLGVKYVNVVPVDNPLAEPFDAELMGFLDAGQYDLAVKSILRSDPNENVGVLVQKEGKVEVIEYTELPDSQKSARNPDGTFLHPCANITLLAFPLKTIRKYSLPLHLAHKSIATKNDPSPLKPNAWKFEKFIFDIFPLIERIGVLVYSREECFAPLKNLTGTDSVTTVQEALKKRRANKRK